jgi:hypothetical protein
MCYRTVTKLELLGVAMVTTPVQKYSVAFLSDEKTGEQRDQYNYALVQYAINALRDPFDAWDVTWTSKRQPHSQYAEVSGTDPCPCESGKTYDQCCKREVGILHPHVEFVFAVDPPDSTPSELFIK